MKITGIEIYHADIPYPEPYVLAHGAWTSGSQVILQVHTDEGISGLGESTFAGGKQWRGNDRETVTSVLSQRFGPALEGKDPLAIERRIDEMEELDYNANAVTAVDNALWDIAGKVYNVPVYQLLGGLARRTISVSRSLPVQDAETMARKAVGLQELGYQLITVKIGFDPREDLERVRAVRRAVGDAQLIEVDANEAYTRETAIPTLRRMEQYELDGIEQPVPWWDLETMAQIASALDSPVIADQSVSDIHDAYNVIQARAGDVVCITLADCGGLLRGKQMAAVCQAAGVPCSLNSRHPLGVGTAAIHHFAASTPWVRTPTGYGGPLERLPDDIVDEPVVLQNGEVTISDRPGLGVELDKAKLEKWAVRVNP